MLFLIILFVLTALIFNKKIKYKITIITTILIIAFLFIFYNQNKVANDSILNASLTKEVKTLYLVSNKYNNLEDISIIGYISDDINNIQKKLENYNLIKYDDINELVNSLNDEVDAIIVNEIEKENLEYNTIMEYTYDISLDIPIYDSNDENIIIYISGMDTYGDINKASRSDVNLLAIINPNSSKILLLSIPRDYYVDVGEELKDKLTHTGINGIQSSINALENLLDININYYVKINFSSFEEIIDLLGGIDIESDTEYKLHNGNYSINKGTNHLDGKMALAFARERYAYINGDRTRVLNSQLILTKVVEKIKKYNNIKECLNIFKIVSKNISTNLSSKLIINYIINEIKNKKDFDVENYALDGFDSYEYTNSYAYEKLYVMLPDENSINEAKIKISEVLNS